MILIEFSHFQLWNEPKLSRVLFNFLSLNLRGKKNLTTGIVFRKCIADDFILLSKRVTRIELLTPDTALSTRQGSKSNWY